MINESRSNEPVQSSVVRSTGARGQAKYWMGTVACDQPWQPSLPTGLLYLRGQQELGEGGFLHWQIFFIASRNIRLSKVRGIFAPVVGHWEPTRSEAAEAYVWKEDTRVGEPFQFGTRPGRRNTKEYWDDVKDKCKRGALDDLDSDIYIRYYRTIKAIASDHLQPLHADRQCTLFLGPTGTGKSHRAWELAGPQAYSKDPRSKFWCGYCGQDSVVIDEFRGGIDISHILRWLDKYPVTVEVKGASTPLYATKFYVTSNIGPERWYPDLDSATLDALLRRITIVECNEVFNSE